VKTMLDLYRGVAKHQGSEGYKNLIEYLEFERENAHVEMENATTETFKKVQGKALTLLDIISLLTEAKDMVKILEDQEKLQHDHINNQ